MTKEQLAKILHGKKYREEISLAEAMEAKENGLVVIYGASDDLMEFAGAIDDEIGAWNGTTVVLNANGSFRETDEGEPVLDGEGVVIEAVWAPEDENGESYASWIYKTELPHATFDIIEDGELYCRGIVFEMKDLLLSATHKTIVKTFESERMNGSLRSIRERFEQIFKHGFSVESDAAKYKKGELAQAAQFCLTCHKSGGTPWPEGWDKSLEQNIINKNYDERVQVASAFLMAEADRLSFLNRKQNKNNG